MPKLVNVPGVGVVEFPDEMSETAISLAIERNVLPQFGIKPPERSGILPALKSGIDRAQSQLYALGTGAANAVGLADMAQRMEAGRLRNIEEADWENPNPAKLDDITSAYDRGGILSAIAPTARLALESTAETIPQMVPAAGMIFGGPVGWGSAALGTAGMLTGANLNRQAEEGRELEDRELGAAALAGIAQTAPELLAERVMLGPLMRAFRPARLTLGKIGLEAAKETAAQKMAGVVRGAATGALKGGAVESPTEMLQSYIERGQAGLGWDVDAEAWDELKEAGIVGGLVGGTLGGAAGPIGARADARARQQQALQAAAVEEARARRFVPGETAGIGVEGISTGYTAPGLPTVVDFDRPGWMPGEPVDMGLPPRSPMDPPEMQVPYLPGQPVDMGMRPVRRGERPADLPPAIARDAEGRAVPMTPFSPTPGHSMPGQSMLTLKDALMRQKQARDQQAAEAAAMQAQIEAEAQAALAADQPGVLPDQPWPVFRRAEDAARTFLHDSRVKSAEESAGVFEGLPAMADPEFAPPVVPQGLPPAPDPIDTAPEPPALLKQDAAIPAVAPVPVADAGRPSEVPAVQPPPRPSNPARTGRDTIVQIPDSNRTIEARYVVRELDEVIPSHNPFSFAKNAGYRIENDRDYRDASVAATVIEHAKDFKRDFLITDNPDLVNGPPLILESGEVIGGNSRAMTLGRVYAENPAGAASYREALVERAHQFGLDPAEISRMNQPILVRLAENVDDVQGAVTDTNRPGTAPLRVVERAVSDSRKITPETLNTVAAKIEAIGSDATLTQALEGQSGIDIYERMVKDGIFSPRDRNAHIDRDRGELQPEVKIRINKMALGRLFGDVDALAATSPALLNKLERVTAPLLRSIDRPDWDLTATVREAVTLLQEAEGRGVKNLGDMVSNARMEYDNRSYSPEALAVAQTLQQGPIKASKSFRQYAQEEALSRPNAPATMWDPPTRDQAFESAFVDREFAQKEEAEQKKRVAEAFKNKPKALGVPPPDGRASLRPGATPSAPARRDFTVRRRVDMDAPDAAAKLAAFPEVRDYMEGRATEQQAVVEMVKRVNPALAIRFAQRMTADRNGHYDADAKLATVAENVEKWGDRMDRIAAEEAAHSIYPLLSDTEKQVLSRAGRARNLMTPDEVDAYRTLAEKSGENPDALEAEEYGAKMVARHLSGQEKLAGAPRGIIDRIKNEAVKWRNWIQGEGYASLNELMGDIESGRVGERQFAGADPIPAVAQTGEREPDAPAAPDAPDAPATPATPTAPPELANLDRDSVFAAPAADANPDAPPPLRSPQLADTVDANAPASSETAQPHTTASLAGVPAAVRRAISPTAPRTAAPSVALTAADRAMIDKHVADVTKPKSLLDQAATALSAFKHRGKTFESRAELDRMKRQLIDKDVRVETLDQLMRDELGSAYDIRHSSILGVRLADRAPQIGHSALTDGVPIYDKDAGVFKVVDKKGGETYRGLLEILKDYMQRSDADKKAFDFVAIAKRTEALGGKMWTVKAKGETAVAEFHTKQEAQAYLRDELDGEGTMKSQDLSGGITPAEIARAKQIEKENPWMTRTFDEYNRYNKQLVQLMIDAGVVAPEVGKVWQSKPYVPFYRHIETDEGVESTRTKAGTKTGLTRPYVPKRLTGSKLPVSSFEENMVRNLMAAVRGSMANVAASRVMRDAVKAGWAREVSNPLSAKHAVSTKDGGKFRHFDVLDPLLFETMQGIDPLDHPWLNLMLKPSHWLRQGVTLSPTFWAANVFRDAAQAKLITGRDIPLVRTMIRGVADSARAAVSKGESKAVRDLRRAGVTGGIMVLGPDGEIATNLRRVFGREVSSIKSPADAFRHVIGALERASERSDAVVREVVYRDALAKGASEAQAIYEALETMNFSRKGASKAVRFTTMGVPFLNARWQGFDVMYRAARALAPGARGTGVANADRNAVRKQFRNVALGMTGMSMAYAAIMPAFAAYRNANDEERDGYWMLPVNETGLSGLVKALSGETLTAEEENAPLMRVPIPFEAGFLFKVIPERLWETMTKQNELPSDFGRHMARYITGELSFNPMPQAIKPAFEVIMNRDMYRDQPIVGRQVETLLPEYQYTERSSEIAKEMGKVLGVSPLKIDHLFRGYGGTMGMYATAVGDALTDVVLDRNKTAPKLSPSGVVAADRVIDMVAGRFIQRPEGTGDLNAFYDFAQEIGEYTQTIAAMAKQGRYEEIEGLMKRGGKKLTVSEWAEGKKKILGDIRAQIRAVQSAPDLNSYEKRSLIHQLRAAQLEAVKDVDAVRVLVRE